MDSFFSFYNTAISTIAGAMRASAARESARAKMSALNLEKKWNLGVMKQNMEDVYARSLMSAFGSGISSSTGSTCAVIANNQRVLQDEIKFRESQYDIELRNLESQSKQRYLGIF